MSEAQQLELFQMTSTNGDNQVEVNVSPCERGYYATIGGGWWIAYGATAQKAAEACFASYEAEINAQKFGLGAWQ